MDKNIIIKIYFAYSGRDMDEKNGKPAKKTIDFLTQPGENGQIYAEETLHSPSNGRQKKTFPEKLRTAFHKSLIVQYIGILFEWILGKWMIDKIPWRRKNKDWRVEAERSIEKSDVLVFLYSTNSWDERNAENIKWEITTAKRLDRNVILCGIDQTMYKAPPWVEKVDNKAVTYSQKDLRDRIIRHSLKKYDYTSLNLRAIVSQPGSEAAERMFEQYKMYKDETEKLTETRQTVANYYILMNGALLTLIGVIFQSNRKPLIIAVVVFLSGFVGIVISNLWLGMVNYYKDLHTAKHRLINAIEESLPLQLNSTEYYEIMKDPLNKGRFKSFGEAMLPNSIHVFWGVLLLLSAVFLLWNLVRHLWSNIPVWWFLFGFVTFFLFDLLIESALRTYTQKRAQKGAAHGNKIR